MSYVNVSQARAGDFTLEEIAMQIRKRPHTSESIKATVGLRIVIFDCPSISWQGIREILVRNSISRPGQTSHGQIVQIKCYYGWQMTVDEHTKRVLRGDLCSAEKLETKWAEHMIAVEDGQIGRRRRRRGRNQNQNLQEADDNTNVLTSWRNGSRRRRGASCAIM